MIQKWIERVLPEMRWVFRVAVAVAQGVASVVRKLFGLQLLRSAARMGIVAVGIAVVALIADATCFLGVPHGHVCVKQLDVGDGGIDERDYPPGVVPKLPFFESGHIVDTRIQVLSFGGEWPGAAPWLEVRMKEGDVAQVSASVVYRVRKGETWKLVAAGLKGAWKQRVRATAEATIPRELGKLSAAEIAATEPRLAIAERLREELDRTLAESHVEVLSVLVTQARFGPEHEKKLQAKQLSVQQERMREAAAEAEALRARMELTEAEIEKSIRSIAAQWDERIAERAAQGKSEIGAIRTETKFYSETRRAAATAEHDRLVMAGDRAMAQAVALKDSLMRKALAGAGGRYWLARKAAENLNIRQVTLDPGDPGVPSVLDLDAMVRLLVGSPATKPW